MGSTGVKGGVLTQSRKEFGCFHEAGINHILDICQ